MSRSDSTTPRCTSAIVEVECNVVVSWRVDQPGFICFGRSPDDLRITECGPTRRRLLALLVEARCGVADQLPAVSYRRMRRSIAEWSSATDNAPLFDRGKIVAA